MDQEDKSKETWIRSNKSSNGSESNQSSKAIKVAIEGAMDQGAMIGSIYQGVRDGSRINKEHKKSD